MPCAAVRRAGSDIWTGRAMKAFVDKRPAFETERFLVVPLSPGEVRKLVEILLQDEMLAARVPWLEEKSRDGALRAAFGLELESAAGRVKTWGIVARERRMQVGLVVARNSLEGIDVEVLVASQFWDEGIADEAADPVLDWLSENSEEIPDLSPLLQLQAGTIQSAQS
jgi:hypothetical protein